MDRAKAKKLKSVALLIGAVALMGLGYLLMSMGESFFSAAGLPRESVTEAEVQLAGEESATALDAADMETLLGLLDELRCKHRIIGRGVSADSDRIFLDTEGGRYEILLNSERLRVPTPDGRDRTFNLGRSEALMDVLAAQAA